jgi:V4R domain-containing protein
MGIKEDIKEDYKESIKILADKSRLEVGSVEASLHCDKFNTRIIKGLEDVIGFKDAQKILSETAEKSTYNLLNAYLSSAQIADSFNSLSPEDKLNVIFELFKVLGYGALKISSINENSGKFVSKSTYLSEGWLENERKWKWAKRENPVCHDVIGYLQSALSLVYGKEPGAFKVTETSCRTKGDEQCEFNMEVK